MTAPDTSGAPGAGRTAPTLDPALAARLKHDGEGGVQRRGGAARTGGAGGVGGGHRARSRSSARSRRSQVNSGSSRPKWPCTEVRE